MAEKIYRLVNGSPVEIEARDPSRRYRMLRIEGAPAYLELTDAEETARDAEEAAPPPPFTGLGRCACTRTGQVIPNANPTAISFDAVVRDVGGYYSESTPDRITVGPRQGGRFAVVVGVRFNESTAAAGGTANAGDRAVQVRVNGQAPPGHTSRQRAAASGDTELTVQVPAPDLAAGDVIRVFVAHNCGGTMAVDARIALERLGGS